MDTNLGPSTFRYVIKSTDYSLTLGYRYRIRIIASNDVGSSTGNIVSAVAADPPAAPASAPTYDAAETNGT